MGPGQGLGCLCAPPTPTSTACLWGVGWITEGFLQDFPEKNIFFSHLQSRRSSPVTSTNRSATTRKWHFFKCIFSVLDCNKALLHHA